MIKLSDKDLNITKQILYKHLIDCKGCIVKVFGSRYKGTPKRFSDLDMVLFWSEKINPFLLQEIKQDFQDSDITIRVDLIDWNGIDSEMKSIITNQGSEILLEIK